MGLDSLKGVAVPKSVRLMWQSTISMGKNFLPIGIILIYKPHRINFQIKSKFYNDSQLTISVSRSPKNGIEHVLICHGSATRYRSEMEMQVS